MRWAFVNGTLGSRWWDRGVEDVGGGSFGGGGNTLKNACKLFESCHFFPFRWCERCSRRWVGEGMDEVSGGNGCCIGRGYVGYGAVVREKLYCACNAFCACFRDVDSEATVVVRGMADVPAIDGMRGKGGSIGWCLVYEYFSAGRRHWCFVIVEGAIELGLGRQAWVDVAGSEEV